MQGQRCGDCRYSKVRSSFIICRRFPPDHSKVGEHSAFPRIHQDDWCGEFYRRRPNDHTTHEPAPPNPPSGGTSGSVLKRKVEVIR